MIWLSNLLIMSVPDEGTSVISPISDPPVLLVVSVYRFLLLVVFLVTPLTIVLSDKTMEQC
jgi:hypothetical protein